MFAQGTTEERRLLQLCLLKAEVGDGGIKRKNQRGRPALVPVSQRLISTPVLFARFHSAELLANCADSFTSRVIICSLAADPRQVCEPRVAHNPVQPPLDTHTHTPPLFAHMHPQQLASQQGGATGPEGVVTSAVMVHPTGIHILTQTHTHTHTSFKGQEACLHNS